MGWKESKTAGVKRGRGGEKEREVDPEYQNRVHEREERRK
jgi:hypothetical protein